MNYNPLVSVIIPCFGHGRFLSQAISSVRSQTYRNIEIIVVDDGSVIDSAIDVLKNLPEDPIPVRFYTHEFRRGPSAARNTAIKNSHGDLIFPLDADDILCPDHLQKAVDALKNPKFSCAYTDMRLFGEQSLVYKPNISLIAALAGDPVPVCVLYRREVYDAVGGYREHIRIGEDTDFATRVMKQGFQYAYISEPLYFYRKHTLNSSTQYVGDGRLEAIKNIYSEHKDLMLQYLPEILLLKENRYCKLQSQFIYETTKEIGVRSSFNLLIKSIRNYLTKWCKRIFVRQARLNIQSACPIHGRSEIIRL